jgi:hypothetical protein
LGTGEVDTQSLKFVEFIEYSPEYDEKYLESLIEQATGSWTGISDSDKWLRELKQTLKMK